MAIVKQIGIVTETDTALPMSPAKSTAISPAQEFDEALPVSVLHAGVMPEEPGSKWIILRRLADLLIEVDWGSVLDAVQHVIDKLFRRRCPDPQNHARITAH